MIIVKLKSREHSFTIPVPYALVRMASGIVTSGLAQRTMRGWLNRHGGHAGGHAIREPDSDPDWSQFGFEQVLSMLESRSTRQAIRQLIKELRRCKGTVLVDIKAQDGSEVLIRL
ncbi:hypothetical protein GZH47_26900 [Paenibacillus rhizovicinus]|uniref:Uncharacterized protein n=1 Tax=Paenibacillus rhizovicinus TaxID=2704463 RepID=A0A6C0PBR1_9BACL|nr:hypothetical protein [Paenibacillus rhizovicinus]QHW34062.1 hypothetical protein GZH47_26900 [Paenibacillus rhizovicinus]